MLNPRPNKTPLLRVGTPWPCIPEAQLVLLGVPIGSAQTRRRKDQKQRRGNPAAPISGTHCSAVGVAGRKPGESSRVEP